MSENEDKQSINNIKSLYKINVENSIPNLFHEVKKAKQQIISISANFKDKLAFIKSQQLEKQKQFVKNETNIEVQEHVSKLAKRTEKAEEDKKSFAELFASSLGEIPNKEEIEKSNDVDKSLEKKEANKNIIVNNKENVVDEKPIESEKNKETLSKTNEHKVEERVLVKEIKEEVKPVQNEKTKVEKTEPIAEVKEQIQTQMNNESAIKAISKEDKNRNLNKNNSIDGSVKNNFSKVENKPYTNNFEKQNSGYNIINKPRIFVPRYNSEGYQNNYNSNQNNNRFNNNQVSNNQSNNSNYKNFNRNSNFVNRNNNQANYQNNFSNNAQQNGFRKPFVPNQNGFRQNNYGQNQNNNQGFNGQNYNRFQKPFNNSNNGFIRPQRPFNTQNANGVNGQRNAQFGQNRALMGIIPKKNVTLTSAASVFANKERSFGNKKKSFDKPNEEEKKINKKSLIRKGLIEEQDIEERMVARKLKLKKPKVEMTPIVSAPITNAVITTPNLTVKILSEKIGKPVTDIIKQLMVLGVMTTINSSIDFQTAELVSSELGVSLELKLEKTFEERLKENAKVDDGTNKDKRPPIVTIVGHVDHGKTTLLDYIRKTHMTTKEAGGITQTIGAYSINWNGEDITFVDTPGHEAFINMRKRGTEITDVAVLIVASDDGIKPQTVEAIKHVKEAKVPMIVAITKIDKPEANIDRIKQQLTEYDILPEEWGGDTIIVPVSSFTGEGIDKLLEMILLVAEMQSLKCNKSREAVGVVIEAVLDKNKGPIANIIVQNGTLRLGDNVVSGFALGKIRAMTNDKGKSINKAGPSMPVSILGLDSVPKAGDAIQVVDEKFSKQVIEERKIKIAQEKMDNSGLKGLDEFLSTPIKEDKKALNILIKANSQGSVEALKQSLLEIKNEEVKVDIIFSGVGNINENDIQLAKVSNATIVTFDTKVLSKISNFAKQNKVEIRSYDIIYNAIEDIEKLMISLMAPKYQEKITGHAEVRALFKISSVGTIAGCYVTDGKIIRNSYVKVLRKDNVVFEGKIATLKREKDDIKEVSFGYECGIKVEGFNDVLEGDILECSVKELIKNN